MNGIPASRYGRRRPIRVRVRSVSTPSNGSVTPSQILLTRKAVPASAGSMRSTSVRNSR